MTTHLAIPPIHRHQLPHSSLTVLSAGGGSPETTAYLRTTEQSRRKLALMTVLGVLEDEPALLGSLPAVDTVWEILSEAEQTGASEWDELLLHPSVGTWSAYVLRRLRTDLPGDVPLWVDFGWVHAVALAVAARAGLTWQTRLPVRDGTTMIPALGAAVFARTAGPVVEARTRGGRIWISGDGAELAVHADGSDVDPADGIGWWSLRRLNVGDSPALSLWLDDIDPYRDLADPVPPARLDPAAFERWRSLLAGAWDILCRDHPDDARAMVGGVTSIVPLQSEPGWENRSASSGEAFGAVMVAEPPDAVTLAVALVHEYQHIQLGALLHLIRTTEPDDGSLYYAPWRDDPRPLGGLLQGVYAFFGIARFWRTQHRVTTGRAADQAAFEFGYARLQVAEAVGSALASASLTEHGRRLFESLREQVVTWRSEPLEPAVATLAEIAAGSHRIGWRLRHLRPDPEQVLDLADRWQQGREPAPVTAAAVRPHPGLRWSQRLPLLTRQRVFRPDAPSTPAPDDLTKAEDLLVGGDARAGAGFLAVIDEATAAEPVVADRQVRAWAGLALALDAADPAARALTLRPDLAYAVHAELRTRGVQAGPVETAAWLVPALSG